MAITDFNQVANTLTGGTASFEYMKLWQDARVGAAAAPASIATRPFSTWAFNNDWGGGGAAPGGTKRNCTRATQGALGQKNPTGGRKLYLACEYFCPTLGGTHQWWDRLMDISGYSGTSAGTVSGLAMAPARGVSTPELCLNNKILIDIYTLIGVTGTTMSVDYKDANGVSRTTPLFTIGGTGFREQYRSIFAPLASGGRGVSEVTGYTLTATTGTAGDFGITIARPAAPPIPVVTSGMGTYVDLVTQQPVFPEILNDACLYAIHIPSTAAFPQSELELSFIEG
jgi:hypothetical protein